MFIRENKSVDSSSDILFSGFVSVCDMASNSACAGFK